MGRSNIAMFSGLFVAGVMAATAWAGEPASAPVYSVPTDPTMPIVANDAACASGDAQAKEDTPQDLTLWNLFSAGWDEAFTRRSSEGRAPDMALLRVQTNFMEREVRVNYFHQHNINSARRENLDDFDVLIAYGLNRRFMIEIVGIEQWVDARDRIPDFDGATARLVGRLQLISTGDSSYSFNFQASAPNRGLGDKQTTLSYGLAGFEDLTRFGLYRVGLYGSVLFDSFAGPHPAGARLDDVQYDITLAKTLTDPKTKLIGNFTVFAELFAQTDLDGDHSGTTLVSITPGVRFNLGTLPGWGLGIDNWIMMGVDIPLSGPRPWDATFRFTYIKNF
jgi:hypothetical protein